MNTPEQFEAVVIRRCAERSQAELYALVLSARGIDSIIAQNAGAFGLLVAPADAGRATEELSAYDAENRGKPVKPKRINLAPPNIEIVLAYWAVLLFFFAAARRDSFSVQWLEIGQAQTGLIRGGEWWRTVTALFLHVDGTHLLSNLAFGTVFLLLLSQILGFGMTALTVLAGGIAGNIMNALVRPADHTSIGASTAIFAAVGLLAALNQNWRQGRLSTSPRDWLPLAGGIMLLAFLGFSEGQTDILAHVFGFVAGVGIGALLAWRERRWSEDGPLQLKSASAAGAIAALAWCCAILVSG